MSILVYNANFNLYALCEFFLELSPAGVMVPSYQMTTVKMDMFVNEDDLPQNIAEACLYLYFLYYIFVEGNELYNTCKETGSIKGYISDAWNVADWIVIIVSFLALSFRLQFFFNPIVRDFNAFAKYYIELSAVAKTYDLSFSIDSIAAFLALLKLFKFFGLQRNLLILRTTIARAVNDLFVFVIVLLLFVFAFVMVGMQIFGQENEEYVNLFNALVTLFLMGFLGDFDYEGLENVNQGVRAQRLQMCHADAHHATQAHDLTDLPPHSFAALLNQPAACCADRIGLLLVVPVLHLLHRRQHLPRHPERRLHRRAGAVPGH
jgi:hypothetical protein